MNDDYERAMFSAMIVALVIALVLLFAIYAAKQGWL